MKSSKFSITALIISFLIFIQALIASLDFPETHPLALILFPLVLLIYLPEYPLGHLPQRLGFPIVLPILSIIFAVISLRKGESKSILSIISIILVLVSILLYLALRFLPAKERKPSIATPPAPFSLCERNDECIHVIAVDESGVPEIQPLTFQDCINKNYKESDLVWYSYGRITEKTGKDLCECRQAETLKMCAFK